MPAMLPRLTALLLLPALAVSAWAAKPLPSPQQALLDGTALRTRADLLGGPAPSEEKDGSHTPVADPALFSWETEENTDLHYRYTFNALPKETIVLLTEEDYIVTMREGVRCILDFWRTGDLGYIMSAYVGGITEVSSDEETFSNWSYTPDEEEAALGYDAESGLFGLYARSRRHADYCYGFDLKNRTTAQPEEIRGLSWSEYASATTDPQFPFINKPYNRLNGKYRKIDSFSLIKKTKLRSTPYLEDITTSMKDEPFTPASIDWETLSRIPEEHARSAPPETLLSVKDIPNLPNPDEMVIESIEKHPDLYFIRPKRWGTDCCFSNYHFRQDSVSYLYSLTRRQLCPMPIDSRMKCPLEVTLGQSDMGRTTISTDWHCGGSLGSWWRPACVHVQESGLLRAIMFPKNERDEEYADESDANGVDDEGDADSEGEEDDESDAGDEYDEYDEDDEYDICSRLYADPIYISAAKGHMTAHTAELLSVWNRLPGTQDQAYWIAADAGLCTLYHVDEAAGTASEVQTWGIDGTPVWSNPNRLLILPSSAMCWQMVRVDTNPLAAVPVARLYMDSVGGFAVVLPNGHYAGTPGCEALLRTHIGGAEIGMQALAPWRNRPAEVIAALGGSTEAQTVAAAVTQRWLNRLGFKPNEDMGVGAEPTAFPSADFPLPRYTAKGNICTFKLRLTATKKAPAYAEIYADGVKIAETQSVPPGKSQSISVRVPLIRGVNHIEVRPVQKQGEVTMAGESKSFRTRCSQGEDSELYVVAVGVSEYQDESLRLLYAAKDARDISAAFAAYGAGKTHMLTLTDSEVTCKTLTERLSAFLAQARPDDRVVCYLAGHGLLDERLNYYYAPSDVDTERLSETAIPLEALTECLQKTQARKRLLLTDTCHAGILGEAGEEKMALAMGALPTGVRAVPHRGMKVRQNGAKLTTAQKKRYIEDLFSLGEQVRGVNILAASAGAELAYETAELQNGLFSASVLEVLRGKVAADADMDGNITLAELAETVSTAVRQRSGGVQRPALTSAERAGDLLLSRHIGHAILQGDWGAVRNMVAAGGCVAELPQRKQSWLGIAMEHAAPAATLELLIQNGADVNKTHSWHDPDATEWWGTYTPLERLLNIEWRRPAPGCTEEERVQALQKYPELRLPWQETLTLLLAHGARVLSVDYRTWSESLSPALFFALIEHGATPDWNAIYWAIKKPDILRTLVEKYGVNLNAEETHTEKELLLIHSRTDEEDVETLLRLGADVNARNTDGMTALIIGAKMAQTIENELKEGRYILSLQDIEKKESEIRWLEERMRLLRRYGADPKLRDNSGKSAADYYPRFMLRVERSG